ncbi:uncharacterized protein SCHCODRAFT_02613114 [Schizophyllum commune H4-8]|nr:uncharacterized protein SCHCODRAFT_02613114 [Schizophyllum commune H4-8]KAI5898769.1 hypothetical protein SCHCODRAFT_02613114 [Schizophyllum commune H4-8]
MVEAFQQAGRNDEDDAFEDLPWQSDSAVTSICDLFDFTKKGWTTLLENDAKRSLDEELELHNLLDLDAAGEEDEEDVFDVDETVEDVLGFSGMEERLVPRM